jgi:hypothetical protein
MPRRKKVGYSEASLTKGQLRKLNALRKTVGDEIAERAFAEWLETQNANGGSGDATARAIEGALTPLIRSGKLRIRRGGYLLRRGRRRVIVEPLDNGDER